MADPVYALIMTAAIVVGVVISRRTQLPLPISPREKFYIGLGAFCGAMIGAKLPFVLSDWDGFLSGAAWFSNGKTILAAWWADTSASKSPSGSLAYTSKRAT